MRRVSTEPKAERQLRRVLRLIVVTGGSSVSTEPKAERQLRQEVRTDDKGGTGQGINRTKSRKAIETPNFR